jgi:hypothetical protein
MIPFQCRKEGGMGGCGGRLGEVLPVAEEREKGEYFPSTNKRRKSGKYPGFWVTGEMNFCRLVWRGRRAGFWWVGEGEEKAFFAKRKRREGDDGQKRISGVDGAVLGGEVRR